MSAGDRSNFAKELRAFGAEIQSVENELFSGDGSNSFGVLVGRMLASAVGASLDIIGKITGTITRPTSMADADYLALIQAQIAFNQSHGEIPRLINAIDAITGTNFQILYEYFPASVYQQFAAFTVPVSILANMRKIKAAGVHYDLARVDPTAAFEFSDADISHTDSGHGFAPDNQSTGGELAELLI